MSYPNNKPDFRKIINKSIRKTREQWKMIMRDIDEDIKKNKEKWKEIMEYCRKNNKKIRELVREAFDRIERNNKEKYDKINDKSTPRTLKIALIFEDIMTTLPEVKRKKRRKK